MSKTVSVGVLSFNSKNTIVETLESILLQDYGSDNIELIISDDASTDDTVNITKDWVAINKNRFKSIITNYENENKGVNANFKKTCNLTNSIWLKIIAADDLLNSNCITTFINYVENNQDADVVFSRCECFSGSIIKKISPTYSPYINMSAQKQFHHLLSDCFIYAPGSFIKKDLIERYSTFDNDNYIMEDYPLWLNLTFHSIKLHLINTPLVKYRISNSMSNSDSKLINKKLAIDTYRCKRKFLSKMNKKSIATLFLYWDLFLYIFSIWIKINIFKNKKNKLNISICRLTTPRLLSPIFIKKKIQSLLMILFENTK